jgi:hypothetical protein
MARWELPEMSPWRRRALTIPPDSVGAWARLAAWELWMGVLVGAAYAFGAELIRARSKGGPLNMLFNTWCGLIVIAGGCWLLWELWLAVAPRPVTDEFLKLLDDSFGRNWGDPRRWPWRRLVWAYGFTLVGALLSLAIGLFVSRALSS